MTRTQRSNYEITISDATSVNIFDIHKTIMAKFKADSASLPGLKEQIAKTTSETALKELTSKKSIIESGMLEAQYIYAARPLLLKYNELLSQKVRINFGDTPKSESKQSEQSEQSKQSEHISNVENTKMKIVEDYLNIAKNYISIKIPDSAQTGKQCPECHIDYVKSDDMQYICPKCGVILNALANTMNYQEDSRINSTSRYMYNKQGHFREAIKKFQGKQNTTVPPEVYTDVARKISDYNIPIAKFTKDHLKEFLKSTGHNEYAEDSNLIHYKLTGVPPPDISHLESSLNNFYDQIEPIYERIKPPGRTNFMNGQYVLFKLLQKLKYPCSYENDFAVLKTRERVLEHDSFWKQICDELCWTFVPT